MSTIRPLATVAILAALGIFLAMKIQQQPIASTAQLTGEWDDAPAFAGGAESAATTGQANAAPALGEAPSFGAPPTFGGQTDAPQDAEPDSGPSFPAPSFPEKSSPATPALPPLPTLPASDPTTAGATPSATGNTTPGYPTAGPSAVDPNQLNLPDLPLPDNIPQATYPGETPAPATVSGRVPSLGTATPDMATPEASPSESMAPASEPWSPPAAASAATSEAAAPPAASAYQPASSPYDSYDPSALGSAPTSEPVASEPGLSYASARPAIQAALDRDELPRAHRLLSQWYGDPKLTPDERSEVDRLLGQLAGTVIYSDKHLLQPAHQVQPGETLETIAAEHDSTWQLLGKINGVAKPDAIEPGQIIKIVPGPFSAVVNLSESEVVLSLDGLYAGRFPAQIDGANIDEGRWTVAGKQTQYQPGSPAADAQGYAKSLSLSSETSGGEIELGAMGDSGSMSKAKISVAARDLGDLFDILSEGSEVTVRR